jgi:hypothetical protein
MYSTRADNQGESSQSSRLSKSPRRVGQSPSKTQPRVDGKLGESSQSSGLSTPPHERPIHRLLSSPLSPPPDYVHKVKKSRKRDRGASTKEARSGLSESTAVPPKTSKSKKRRGHSPSLPISTASDLDDELGIPDIGLPMSETMGYLWSNLEDHAPEESVKEEKPLNWKAVAPVRERTKLPEG